VRAPDTELIQHRDHIRDAPRHRVCLRIVRLVAASDTPVVDEDAAELVRERLQRLGDG